ncbi:3736_t:CDS:2, partial [Scutellospora calospora]
MGFFLTIIFGQILQTIFFGRLRAVEIEMEQSPAVPISFHVRIVSLMEILCAIDIYLVYHAVDVTLKNGPNMMIMFAFEYSILGATIISTIFKYILNVIDMRREDPWENKSIYVFYLELVTDFFKLITYLIFFAIILVSYGIPLHIIRDVYVTLRSFLQKCGDLVRYRRATRNMNERYPNATNDELERLSDRTCIICREEMVAAAIINNNNAVQEDIDGRPQARQGNNGLADVPKKLPCGHIFHFHCLRSWLERQQSCPTCRRPVLSEQQPTPTQPQPRPIPARHNNGPQPPQPQPQLPGIPFANPPGFLANPIPGFPPVTLFPPPGMHGQWHGPPNPLANVNERNVDGQANTASGQNTQQSAHQSTTQNLQNNTQLNTPNVINPGDRPLNEEDSAPTSGAQTTTNPERRQPPSMMPRWPWDPNVSTSFRQLNSSQPSSIGYQPYVSQFPLHVPPGLIPLFPVLPLRDNGTTNVETNTLNNLSEDQIRLLETTSREALVERLRILQDTQVHIYNAISMLTQVVSVLPEVPVSEIRTTDGNLSSETNTNTQFSENTNSANSTVDSLSNTNANDVKNKKGKGK